MACKTPVFPITEPHHYSDYGFDSHFDYFQVSAQQPNRHKRPSPSSSLLHFNLQKPISKHTSTYLHHTTKKRKKSSNPPTTTANKKRLHSWWKSALFYLKSKWPHTTTTTTPNPVVVVQSTPYSLTSSISTPIYSTDSGSTTPFRLTRPNSGNLIHEVDNNIPYFCLSQLNNNLDDDLQISTSTPPPMPIYLVT